MTPKVMWSSLSKGPGRGADVDTHLADAHNDTMPLTSPTTLTEMISAVVGPVALVTSTAILLSGFTGKYTSLSSQFRALTAEYRNPGTTPIRKKNLVVQLCLFERRLNAMWACSLCLCLALVAFLTTVLAVYLSERHVALDRLAIVSMGAGLVFVALAVVSEIYEIALAKRSAASELHFVLDEEDQGT